MVPIAATKFPNLKIYQGVFENGAYNSNANTSYLDTAIKLANEYPNVVAVVVGTKPGHGFQSESDYSNPAYR